MSQKVTITYSAPGLRPPVYITTSLSEPAWEIIEMPFTKKPRGETLFHIDFDAGEGEYQYKFRLGPGDWWVCDTSKPLIDDGFGNQNNVLFVEGDESFGQLSKVDSVHDVAGHALKIGDVSLSTKDRNSHAVMTGSGRANGHADGGILMDIPVEVVDVDEDSASTPPAHTGAALFDLDTDTDQDDEPAPLLRHETNSPDQREHPMHLSPVTSPTKSISSGSSFEDVFCPEADPNDPTLHQFPTHHEGIISEIKRTHRKLPEDKTNGAHDLVALTPKANGVSNLSLPSVAEAYEEVGSTVADQSRSKSSTNGDRWFDHSHTPAHHHAHHRKSSVSSLTTGDTVAEPQLAQGRQRSILDNILEAVLGLGLAVIVAVVAMALYRSGLLGSHINVKDGDATLHE